MDARWVMLRSIKDLSGMPVRKTGWHGIPNQTKCVFFQGCQPKRGLTLWGKPKMIKITLPKFNNVKIGRNCLRNKRLIVFKKTTCFRRHGNLHGGSVDGRNPVECANLANRGINYLSPGARFLPSTVSPNTKPIRKQHEVKQMIR